LRRGGTGANEEQQQSQEEGVFQENGSHRAVMS
jgi:hypothetical protein